MKNYFIVEKHHHHIIIFIYVFSGRVTSEGADEFLRIDEHKGQIWSNTAIDRETFDFLDADVIASDGENESTYKVCGLTHSFTAT